MKDCVFMKKSCEPNDRTKGEASSDAKPTNLISGITSSAHIFKCIKLHAISSVQPCI